jgi:hypothetical protein
MAYALHEIGQPRPKEEKRRDPSQLGRVIEFEMEAAELQIAFARALACDDLRDERRSRSR